VIGPRLRPPGVNCPSMFVPNHCPNWAESVNARQTFDRGARSTTVFWMRSVALRVVGDWLVVLMTASFN
jgi:hypothetical protein